MKKIILSIFAIALISSLFIFIGCDEDSPTKKEIKEYEWNYIGLNSIGLENEEMWGMQFLDNKLYVYANGVFRYNIDNGKWDTLLKTNSWVEELVIDKDSNQIIIGIEEGGNLSGILKSTDDGVTWKSLQNGLPSGPNYITALAQHPTNKNILIASVKWKGLYKSSNRGDSWELLTANFAENVYIEAIAFEKDNSSKIWICGQSYILGQGLVGYSTDNGATWNFISDSEIRNMTWMLKVKKINATMYAVGLRGFFKYISSSNSFSKLIGSDDVVRLSDFCANPSNENELFVCGNAIYYSNNGGQTFQTVRLPELQQPLFVKAMDADWNRRIIYIGIEGKGIYKKNF